MSYPLSEWTLPPAWRAVFYGLESLDRLDPIYVKLCALTEGGHKALANDLVESWHVDQDSGKFSATLTNNASIEAQAGFIGTHDGQSFQWADVNDSILAALAQSAKTLRAKLPSQLTEIATEDVVAISIRDATILLGLAADLVECDLVYATRSGGTVMLLVLSNVELSDESSKSKPSFLQRLFERTRPQQHPLSPAEQIGALRRTVEMALNQWQRNLLPFDRLRALEPLVAKAQDALLSDDAAAALARIDAVKAELGPFPQDQEPTGWVYFAEGIAALAGGDFARAKTALDVAGRAIVPVSRVLILLAMARAAISSDDRDHFLKAAYLRSPDAFAKNANQDEQTRVSSALSELANQRSDLAPADMVKVMIQALYDFEVEAFARTQEAQQFRQQRHVLCEAGDAAKLLNSKAWVDLLLTWATPERAAHPASLSSDPEFAPDRIIGIEFLGADSASATFDMITKNLFGEGSSTVRISLKRTAIPFLEHVSWRVARMEHRDEGYRYDLF